MDILQFAGLAYLFMALIEYLNNIYAWIFVALLSGALSPFLWGGFNDSIAYIFLRLLWGTGENVSFPFFPWIVYPLVGMVFGRLLSETKDVTNVFRSFLWVGIILLLFGTVSFTNVEFHFGDYYRSGPGALVLLTGFVFIWLGLFQWLTTVLPGTRVGEVLSF